MMSKNWRKQQAQDLYFRKAKAEGYRARSAYKLRELNEKFGFLKSGARVVDLGAAPGSWSQVAAQIVGARGRVVAVDIAPVEPIARVEIIQADVCAARTVEEIRARLEGKADAVLSDMAPSTTGIAQTDHARSLELASAALRVARAVGKRESAFVAKVFEGPDLAAFVAEVKKFFKTTRVTHPEASRKESRETFVVAMGLLAESDE